METVFHALYVILVSAAFGAALLLASRTLFLYVWSQINPGNEIVLGTFTAFGEGLPTDTKAVGSALASKLERLKRLTSRERTGFGLVQSTVLMSVPELFNERQSDARKRLENLNLKVKDVDVNALVGAVRSLFEPARPTLEGQVTAFGDRIEIRAELLWRGEIIGGWIASRLKSAKVAEALNDVYDDLLFQISHDIPRNPKLHWFANSAISDDIPNWQTLEGVTLGLEALQTYAESLEYADLQRAIKQLERVQVHAPGYAVGHYFLAIALGEDRQEQRSAGLLSQVERMNSGQFLKWNAALQRAAAMLRQYSAKPAEEAVTQVLDPLITSLTSAVTSTDKKRGAEREFASRLLPMAYAQLAYTYGTLFMLHSTWPGSDLRRKSEDASRQALDHFNKVKDWPSDREREKKEVERWIYNARGYSSFRIAGFEREKALEAKKPAEQVNNDFRQACNAALDDLRKANEILPNSYEVLQDQAMILEDVDYDPGGALLTEAEALYGRTKLFVPRDYYQYERLSGIYWRQLREDPPASVQTDLASKGSEAVSLATKYRYPGKSQRAAVLGAYFGAVAARLEADPAKKRQKLTEAIDLAKYALSPSPTGMMSERQDAAKAMKAAADTLGDKDEADKKVKQNATEVADRLKPPSPAASGATSSKAGTQRT
jgi:hypothetical protein